MKHKSIIHSISKLFTVWLVLFIANIVLAQVNPNHHYVKGYHRKDGTYVKGHYRTNPNSTNRDNYSTKPNTNPWTGKKGWIEPEQNTSNYNYYYQNSTPAYIPNNKPFKENKWSTTRLDYNFQEKIKYHSMYTKAQRFEIEKFLDSIGYNAGVVDGIFTSETIIAIKKLQKLIGATVDGKFGKETIDKLDAY